MGRWPASSKAVHARLSTTLTATVLLAARRASARRPSPMVLPTTTAVALAMPKMNTLTRLFTTFTMLTALVKLGPMWPMVRLVTATPSAHKSSLLTTGTLLRT